jgi:hypothetical protein
MPGPKAGVTRRPGRPTAPVSSGRSPAARGSTTAVRAQPAEKTQPPEKTQPAGRAQPAEKAHSVKGHEVTRRHEQVTDAPKAEAPMTGPAVDKTPATGAPSAGAPAVAPVPALSHTASHTASHAAGHNAAPTSGPPPVRPALAGPAAPAVAIGHPWPDAVSGATLATAKLSQQFVLRSARAWSKVAERAGVPALGLEWPAVRREAAQNADFMYDAGMELLAAQRRFVFELAKVLVPEP